MPYVYINASLSSGWLTRSLFSKVIYHSKDCSYYKNGHKHIREVIPCFLSYDGKIDNTEQQYGNIQIEHHFPISIDRYPSFDLPNMVLLKLLYHINPYWTGAMVTDLS
jgi:hypothetical protein